MSSTLLEVGFLVLVAAVPILIVVMMFRRARGAGWVRDPSALDGQGTITAVKDTGTTMNEAAQFKFTLDVSLPGQAPYEATVKTFVSRVNFGTLTPGMTVAVKVKPEDHTKVWIDFGQPVTAAGSAAAGGAGATSTGPVRSSTELLASGTPGWAVLRTAQPLGMTAAEAGGTPEPGTENDPIYLIEVDVSLDGGAAAFPARFGHRVPQDRIASLAPGSNLRVAVDPSHPSEAVAIDWSAS